MHSDKVTTGSNISIKQEAMGVYYWGNTNSTTAMGYKQPIFLEWFYLVMAFPQRIM